MENNSNNNKRKIITIVLGVISLFLIIGVSYAVWRYTYEGQTANTLEKEMIELELLESTDEVISITNALPISDTQGIEQSETFEFAVTTRTEAVTDIFYDLQIEKLNVDSGYTALQDSDIRVHLTDYNNKNLIAPIKISDLNNYTFYKTYNSHTSETTEVTTKYKLKVWLDQEVDTSNWNENTKLQYKFKIGVEGEEYNRDAVSLNPKGKVPEGAYYANLGTGTFYDEMPETVSAGDHYLYGDYVYIYNYSGETNGWEVFLALEEFFADAGMSEMFAAYPKPTRNQTVYDPILESINGVPITSVSWLYQDCTSLEELPVIPKSVISAKGIFSGWTSLKSDTNVYSFNTNNVHTGTPLDSINGYTTNYKNLNKTFFLKHNIGSLGRIESQEVCYILNNKKYCLKGGDNGANYETNKTTLLESFGEESCSVGSDYVYCALAGLLAWASDDGYVYADGDDWRCNVYSYSDAYCYEW